MKTIIGYFFKYPTFDLKNGDLFSVFLVVKHVFLVFYFFYFGEQKIVFENSYQKNPWFPSRWYNLLMWALLTNKLSVARILLKWIFFS